MMAVSRNLIVATMAISLLIFMLIVSKKNKLIADKYLLGYIGFFLFYQLLFLIESVNYFNHSYLPLFTRGFYLVCTPLFYLYLLHLTSLGRKLPSYRYLLFVPFIYFTLLFITYYLIGFERFSFTVENGILYQNGEISVPWIICSILLLLIDPICLLICFKSYKSYLRSIEKSHSNTDKINLGWIRVLLFMWAISILIVIPLHIISLNNDFLSTTTVSAIHHLFDLITVFIIGWFGVKQRVVYDFSPVIAVANKTSYSRSGLSEETADEIHDALLQYMSEKKPYLNGELKAADICEALNISNAHLSQVLSQKQGQNFFEFINEYRIEAVKEKMSDSKYRQYTLLGIALESGFNSKTTFNTLFKKYEGMTPSAYYRGIQ